jgi:hypothetical protein
MSLRSPLRFCLLAATVWLSATPAPAQQYNTLPPNSFVGNLTGQSNPGSAVTHAQLIAALGSNVQLDQMTKVGDANYQILSTDRFVAIGNLTSSRTWTLPAANLMIPGHPIVVVDLAGGLGISVTLTIASAGSDRINGVPSGTVTINVPFGAYYLVSDGVSAWNAQPLTGISITPGAGVTSSVSAACAQSAIRAFGVLSAAECVNAQTGVSYAIADADRAKLITASNSGAQAYTIAQAGNASAFQAGWFADIKNISTAAAGIVTITPTGSTINGASTLVLWPGQGGRIVSDGANYQVDFAVGAPLTNSLGADVPPAPVESMDAARAR